MKNVLTSALLSLFAVSTFHVQVNAHKCKNVAGWRDSEGDKCKWYKRKLDDDEVDDIFEDRCEAYGNCCENDGHTAQTACCVCGGGEDFLDTCEDVADFTDCGGDTCDFYANGEVGDDDYIYGDDYDDEIGSVCSYWGYRCAGPSGLTANEACCACGGGLVPTHVGSSHSASSRSSSKSSKSSSSSSSTKSSSSSSSTSHSSSSS